ncbi:MAG TPA: hypothetical protein VI197_01335 [Polyangiaceae bacterium]
MEERTDIKEIVAARGDGLGARLGAILNAMVLAEVLDLPFFFAWPPMVSDAGYHAIAPVSEIFSKEFIDRHYREAIDLGSYQKIMESTITAQLIADVRRDPKLRGLLIEHWYGPVPVEGHSHDAPALLRAAFARIGFSTAIQRVLAAARRVPLQDCIAIHARRGDIVYGDYRFRLFNAKYTPRAIVKAVIRSALDSGHRVLLFSDDAATLELMKQEYSVVLSSDLGGANFSSAEERAIFDLVVMSRCHRIICNRSCFAIMAHYIGKAPMHDIIEYYGKCEAKRSMLADLEQYRSQYTDLEAAKTYQYVAIELAAVVSHPERTALLSKASELDPDNYAYAHTRALDLMRRGELVEADRVLGVAAERYFDSGGQVTAELAKGFHVLEKGRKQLAKAAASPLAGPYTCAHWSHELLRTESAKSALPFAQRAHELAPASVLLAARLSSCLLAVQRTDEANALLSRFLDAGVESPVMHLLRADVYQGRREKRKALEDVRGALRLSPSHPYCVARLAWQCALCGKTSEAKKLVALVPSHGDQDPAVLYLQAKTLERLGDLQSALKAATVALQMRPKKAHYRERVASIKAALEHAGGRRWSLRAGV